MDPAANKNASRVGNPLAFADYTNPRWRGVFQAETHRMNEPAPESPANKLKPHNRAFWGLLAGCLLLGIVGVWLQSRVGWRQTADQPERRLDPVQISPANGSAQAAAPNWKRWSDSPRTAEEIVQSKLAQFGKSRREIVERIAARDGATVPAEVAEFFEALARGHWEEIEQRFSAFAKRSGQYEGSTYDPSINAYWPAILEAYGAAEQAHLWPAEQLLDYGESILGSLRPGMVYVGGTDSGRFVPTLLNETSGADSHVIFTQNAIVDSRYMEYVRFLHGDRINLPSPDDEKRFFAEYIEDAGRRLEHDQQFPDEPKQLRPGEDIRMVDGKVEASGRVAVMTIAERMMQDILDRNPEISFAMEESFPLKDLYAESTSLGPIMELRADNGGTLSAESAADTLQYWQETARDMAANSAEAPASDSALKTWSHMAVAQANLLAAKRHGPEAEAIYRLASQMYPENVDAVLSYAEFLSGAGRTTEAQQMVADFSGRHAHLRAQLEQFGQDMAALRSGETPPDSAPSAIFE